MSLLSDWQVAGFLVLHFGGIACALGTRVAAGSRLESLFQWLLLPALGAVGVATWVCHSEDLGVSLFSGVTLVGMVLLAVTDLRRTHDPAAPHSLAIHR